MDYETILFKDLGPFGRYQVKLMLICMIVSAFNSWSSSEYWFTTARISTRCLIPECDPETRKFSPWWGYRAIPQDNGALDNCRRFAGNSSAAAAFVDTCPAHLFDQNRLERCQEYVYENTDTIVYDGSSTFKEFSFVLLGSFGLVSGALIFLTPETLGTKLPDTMEEAKNLEKETALLNA